MCTGGSCPAGIADTALLPTVRAPPAALRPAAALQRPTPALPLVLHTYPCTQNQPVVQVADWGRKIEGIVEWFGQLQEVDVEGVPPALRADVEGASTLRPDEVVRRAAGEDLLQQAADREGPFVR